MNEEKILDLLATVLQIDNRLLRKIPKTTRLSTLGLDSLSFVQFIVAVENTFDIEITDSDLLLQKFETIEGMFATLNKYFLQDNTVKKVLVCDCDNVLWHGIAGEEVIFTDELTDALQSKLLTLYDHGVILCLCSKNELQNLGRAFTEHEMPLKLEHILITKANLETKFVNVLEISEELGLSLNSFVFLDDSDYEIGLINNLLPEVRTIKVTYPNLDFLKKLDELFITFVPAMNRTQQYRQQKEREKEKLRHLSVESYNATLQTISSCGPATQTQAARIAELSMRTNRFNLSCKRYSPEDIAHKIEDDLYTVLALSAKDKFGDMGLVGAAIVHNQHAVIEAFFLSCRVFGRGFEDQMLEQIKSLFPDDLIGTFIASDSNQSFSDFYTKNGVRTK